MRQAVHGGRVEHHVIEAGDMGLDFPVHFHQLVPGGRLHPGVRHNDPDGAEMGAQGDHAGGEEVHFGAHLVPAEEQDGQEAGFQEEGEDAFRRQRAAEDVAHAAGIVSPVGAELEFHHDAGGHAQGEDDAEYLGPEFGLLVVEFVLRFQPEAFQRDQNHPQADGHRREDVVEHDRNGELKTG